MEKCDLSVLGRRQRLAIKCPIAKNTILRSREELVGEGLLNVTGGLRQTRVVKNLTMLTMRICGVYSTCDAKL